MDGKERGRVDDKGGGSSALRWWCYPWKNSRGIGTNQLNVQPTIDVMSTTNFGIPEAI